MLLLACIGEFILYHGVKPCIFKEAVMAQFIAQSYNNGQKNVVSQVAGFVQAKQVFDLLKDLSDQFLAIQFYDEWCFYKYTGRIMET